MFYVTKVKYVSLLNALSLNIPFRLGEERSYYQYSKLTSFDLDLSYFTQSEAKALLISDLLFKDTEELFTKVLIEKIQQEQENWVFDISLPRFHINKGCKYLNSDFSNVRIPKSLDANRKDEYREYFIAHYKNYGFSEGARDPRIFMRELIERFNLNETITSKNVTIPLTIDQMVEFYFKKEYYPNSEVEEFNATLDFDKEASRIKNLIDCFKDLVRGYSPQECRSAYFKKNDGVFNKIYEQRKALLARILNFHFQKLSSEGFNLSQKVFKLIGFEPCRHCTRHLIMGDDFE